MTVDPWDTLVDQVAARVTAQVRPALVDAVEARKLPALAVTVAEACEALGVGRDTVRNLIDLGHLEVLPDTGAVRHITVASLHRYAGWPLLPQLRAVREAS